MPIYFLRHEERDKNDFMFRSNLNERGRQNSETFLKGHLDMIKFDKIYASPFLRVLQTLHPTVKCYKKNSVISVDYAIAEYIHDSKFRSYTSNDFILTKEEMQRYYVDYNYKSSYDVNKLKYKESIQQLIERTKEFMNLLIHKHDLNCETILVCSHRSTIVALINNLYPELNVQDNDSYGMGKLSTVMNLIDNDGIRRNRLTFLN